MDDGCYVATANAGGEKSPSEDGLKRFHGNKNKIISILLFIGHGRVSAYPTTPRYTRHTSSCLCVGSPYSPQSLTCVSSWGFVRLPPSRNSNYFWYKY
ncbi:hypothetical protein DMB84_014155 [Pectobacterium aquaticum]|uniref:Uncharacterized protein n=1 Tax=Pectobacterium aquaticum TaxID=2204145 RepID=A0AA93AKE5_9GAMM|nr:hypothetical protein F164LOC_16310 [Pectobacterium carotovorum]RRO00480.1 hypothetical protein DMB79_001450 [Pectobacterium aquaticum]RRO02899.1 hypothetical protein DMB83_008065 [Pectobacterium aquaticum]RRO08545.1 hypothetical protein DMB85_011255 [Pectobacterium aquaticum]RRO17719.1 hypothetical protein DMB84_014155 [Pectobacterium aquaticum]